MAKNVPQAFAGHTSLPKSAQVDAFYAQTGLDPVQGLCCYWVLKSDSDAAAGPSSNASFLHHTACGQYTEREEAMR